MCEAAAEFYGCDNVIDLDTALSETAFASNVQASMDEMFVLRLFQGASNDYFGVAISTRYY